MEAAASAAASAAGEGRRRELVAGEQEQEQNQVMSQVEHLVEEEHSGVELECIVGEEMGRNLGQQVGGIPSQFEVEQRHKWVHWRKLCCME